MVSHPGPELPSRDLLRPLVERLPDQYVDVLDPHAKYQTLYSRAFIVFLLFIPVYVTCRYQKVKEGQESEGREVNTQTSF